MTNEDKVFGSCCRSDIEPPSTVAGAMYWLRTQIRPSKLGCVGLRPVQRVEGCGGWGKWRASAGNDGNLVEFPRRQALFQWISTRPPGDVVLRVYALVTLTGVGIFVTAPDELYYQVDTDAASLFGVFILITFAVERFLEPLRSFLDVDGGGQEEMDRLATKIGKAIAMLQEISPEISDRDWAGAAEKLGPSILQGIAEKEEEDAHEKTEQQQHDVAVVKEALVDAQASRINLARVKMNTAVIFWGIASCLSMLLAEGARVGILHVVGLRDVSIPLDLIVTGLAVGAGTKPINELISRLERR